MKLRETFPQGLFISAKQMSCPGGRTTASPQDDKWTLFKQGSIKSRVVMDSVKCELRPIPFGAAGGGR